jgi:hypothetical protein
MQAKLKFLGLISVDLTVLGRHAFNFQSIGFFTVFSLIECMKTSTFLRCPIKTMLFLSLEKFQSKLEELIHSALQVVMGV